MRLIWMLLPLPLLLGTAYPADREKSDPKTCLQQHCRQTKPKPRKILPRSLSARITGGGGTLWSEPSGVICGKGNSGRCLYSFPDRGLVVLNAQSLPGWRLKNWSGACRGRGECVLRPGKRLLRVGARFEKIPPPGVSAGVVVQGQGLVLGIREEHRLIGEACDGRCEIRGSLGEGVLLVPRPQPGWRFLGWQGCRADYSLSAQPGTCKVELWSDSVVRARFVRIPKISLRVKTQGGGLVLTNRQACIGSCGYSYSHMSRHMLRAHADPGWRFLGWQDDCQGRGVCALRLDETKRVVAKFGRRHYPLRLSRSGGGQIKGCPGGCINQLPYGTTVRLEARPRWGWFFRGWQGDCQGHNKTCQLSLDQARRANAVFGRSKILQVAVEEAEGGIAWSEDSRLQCPGWCQADYIEGDDILVRAYPRRGWRFLGWEGDCQRGACRLLVDGNQKVKPLFGRLRS